MLLVLRGDQIFKMSGVPNVHQLALRVRLSYQTVSKYIGSPEAISMIDMRVLTTLLADGCGLTADQIENLRIGDIFNVQENSTTAAR